MTYPEALAWLYATQKHGIKLGLDNVRTLLGELGWHPRGQRFLHVAGTNGKGSVCAMLDAICRAQGLRTGLFTSPHLVTFRERIRLGGEMIGEEEVAKGLDAIRAVVRGWEPHPTFFEITTALALVFFQQAAADVVVLETGMGGRLDSTNVVTPLASIITPIDLDHQAFLGATLEKIAGEKAGIIKPGVPVISAPQAPEAAEVLRQTAVAQGASLRFVTQPLADFEIALPGSHQRLNAALARAALDAAKVPVDEAALREGLRGVNWAGRFQIVDERIVLDGAHNVAAAQRLAQTWRESFGEEKATIVAGILRDKDIGAICAALAPIAAFLVAVPVRSQRSSNAEEICAAAGNVECAVAHDLAEALRIAKSRRDKVLVTGSLFLVGEALALLELAREAPEISLQ